jgi:polyisoprenoid-binding protein YceI
MNLRRLFSVALVCFIASSAYAAERAIDASASKLTVKVWKTGFFSAFAHDHEISAPITSGAVVEGDHASVNFVVSARALKVLDPDASASTRAEVEHNMLSAEVLDTQRFAEIAFHSSSVHENNGALTVSGDLTLHGQTHPVEVRVRRLQDGKYEGTAKLKQTTFGIEPIKIGGGAIKVKDEVDISFTIVLR